MGLVTATGILRKVQRYGENILGAALAVALLQGTVVLYRYRNNPKGGLMIPPGLTWGVELPQSEDHEEETSEQRRQRMFVDPKRQLELLQRNQKVNLKERITMPGKDFMKRMQEVVQESMDEQQIHQNNDGEYEDYFHNGKSDTTTKNSDESEGDESNQTALDKVKKAPDKLKKSWQRLNQYAIVLLPWLAQQMSYVLARYGHLMHLGLIYGVGSILELRSSKIPSLSGSRDDDDGGLTIEEENDSHITGANNQLLVYQAEASDLHIPCKVVVIGDSLACGIGTIDHFDERKSKKDLSALIENISVPGSTDERKMRRLIRRRTTFAASSRSISDEPEKPQEILERPKEAAASPYRDNAVSLDHTISDCWGPAFPRILAVTLAQRLGRPVQWRSAGVDGGDVPQIRQFCLDVIKQEVASGHAPDLVVVLCGSNDLKTIVGNPLKALTSEGGPAGSFRRNLVELLQDILRVSPKTKIVLPALPTHRLDQGSMLNVFPLTFFLDGLLGFWDAQKKKVADSSPSNIIYCGLTTENVSDWYQMPPDAFRDSTDPVDRRGTSSATGNEESISLISADGVHPSKRCYSLWANLVGNTVADRLLSRLTEDLQISLDGDIILNKMEDNAS